MQEQSETWMSNLCKQIWKVNILRIRCGLKKLIYVKVKKLIYVKVWECECTCSTI